MVRVEADDSQGAAVNGPFPRRKPGQPCSRPPIAGSDLKPSRAPGGGTRPTGTETWSLRDHGSVRDRGAAAVGAEGEFEKRGAFLLVAKPSRNPVLFFGLQNQFGRKRIESFVSAAIWRRNGTLEGQMLFGCIHGCGLSSTGLRRGKMPGLLNGNLDGSRAA